MNKFKLGDAVTHLLIKQFGTISGCLSDDTYKVAIGSMEILSSAEHLAIREAKKDSPISKHVAIKHCTPARSTLDLHGKTVQQAEEEVLTFISNAVVANLSEVRIIHGHGSGKVKAAVQRVLSSLTVVASFRHEINNTAVTKVYF